VSRVRGRGEDIGLSVEASWNFWLKCGACGDVSERVVVASRLQRLSSGGFAPLPCLECGSNAAAPTVRPWDLTTNDRRFLRSMRIAAA
jgi:hypothetical protein